MNKFIYLAFIIGLRFQSVTAEEIRHLDPPLLEQINIGKKIVCHRPFRKKSPNISLERAYNKLEADT